MNPFESEFSKASQALQAIDQKLLKLRAELREIESEREQANEIYLRKLDAFKLHRRATEADPNKKRFQMDILRDVFQNFRIDMVEKSRFVCYWWNDVIQTTKDTLPRVPPRPKPKKNSFYFWLKETHPDLVDIPLNHRREEQEKAYREWGMEIVDKSRWIAMVEKDRERYGREKKAYHEAQVALNYRKRIGSKM